MTEATHEYVDLMLDVKDGRVVSSEFFGEGKQVEPLTEPLLLKPLDSTHWPRGWRRIERQIKSALRRL